MKFAGAIATRKSAVCWGNIIRGLTSFRSQLRRRRPIGSLWGAMDMGPLCTWVVATRVSRISSFIDAFFHSLLPSGRRRGTPLVAGADQGWEIVDPRSAQGVSLRLQQIGGGGASRWNKWGICLNKSNLVESRRIFLNSQFVARTVVLDTNRWYHQTVIVSEEMSITIGAEYDWSGNTIVPRLLATDR